MSRERRAGPGPDLSRRGAIKLLGAGLGAAAAGKAADNVLLGYGDLVGTNLRAQERSGDLAALAAEGFLDAPGTVGVPGARLVRRADRLLVRGRDGTDLASLPLPEATPAAARAVDDEHGLEGATEQVVRDVGAVRRGELSFEFARSGPFFERVGAAEPRPYMVGLARGEAAADPDAVAAFAGADPADPAAVVAGLVEGFREHAYYDVPRYAAGSVQDNVLLGAVDLRRFFREPVDFASLADEGRTGVFCFEFVARSIEALHAAAAPAQSPPVVAGYVHDGRHKHAYTALASVVREDGELVVPTTFVDYTHATLYDDLALRGVLGDGLEAYNDRHRADAVWWV